MVIWFRVDASLDIGTGHVVRCLTLADMLVSLGAECSFVCKAHEGNLIDVITARGFPVFPLSLADNGCGVDVHQPSHASWLGGGWLNDADQTLSHMDGGGVDWVVVDHYALDQRWEKRLRSACTKMLAIDDLADRYHDCDLLLDQTFGRAVTTYRELVPSYCKVYSGSKYALLRPEFLAFREISIERKSGSFELTRLLISMGGIDKDNVTGQILCAIEGSSISKTCKVTVVMGAFAPWLLSVKEQAAKSLFNILVKVDINNMAEEMANSDLAIGAAGGGAWERCSLGLPTILLPIAKNQIQVAESLGKVGAVRVIRGLDDINVALDYWENQSKEYRNAVNSCLKVCDGNGARRLAQNMYLEANHSRAIVFRKVTMEDAETLLDWRNNPITRSASIAPDLIQFEGHRSWLQGQLQDKSQELLIAIEEGQEVGLIRFTFEGPEAEVHINLNPGFFGEGLGSVVLASGINFILCKVQLSKINAIVKADNQPSRACFKKCGFTDESERVTIKGVFCFQMFLIL